MKYFVIAEKWDGGKQEIVKEIMGSFDDFTMAQLFQTAYNDRYHANAIVRNADYLIKYGA